MNRAVLAIALLAALAGCTDNGPADPADADAADGPPPAAGDARTVTYTEHSGTSWVREVGVCPADGGCLGYRAGDFAWDFSQTFTAPHNTTRMYVTATWNTTVPDLERLYVFVFEGEYFDNHRILASAKGSSPLTIAVDGANLSGPTMPVGVGFSADAPATANPGQEIHWTAVALS